MACNELWLVGVQLLFTHIVWSTHMSGQAERVDRQTSRTASSVAHICCQDARTTHPAQLDQEPGMRYSARQDKAVVNVEALPYPYR